MVLELVGGVAVERPIETRTLGETTATGYRITTPWAGALCVQFVSKDRGGEYEKVRITMPEDMFFALIQSVRELCESQEGSRETAGRSRPGPARSSA